MGLVVRLGLSFTYKNNDAAVSLMWPLIIHWWLAYTYTHRTGLRSNTFKNKLNYAAFNYLFAVGESALVPST